MQLFFLFFCFFVFVCFLKFNQFTITDRFFMFIKFYMGIKLPVNHLFCVQSLLVKAELIIMIINNFILIIKALIYV